MAEPARKPQGYHLPGFAFFIVLPLCLVSTVYGLQWIHESHNVLPAYIPKDANKVAMRCLGLATLPMLLFVLIVINFRVTTKAGNTLIDAESPLMKVQIKTLSNTAEQTLIFALNLLAYSTQSHVTSEKIVLLTASFIAARLIFWIGYNFFYFTGITMCRSPGMVMTLGVNFYLLAFNLTGFLS